MNTFARVSSSPFPTAPRARSGSFDEAGPGGGQLSFFLVETIDDLGALEADWTALFERHGRPEQVFQTFSVLWTWYRFYGDRGGKLTVVTGWVDGRLMLVWPLVATRRFGLRVLTTMGEPVSQYSDLLVDPALSAGDLTAALTFVMAQPFDVLALRRVRADAALASIVRRFEPTALQHAPFIDFAGVTTIEAFETRYSGKLRSTRRRHLRRLEEQGAVRFEHHGPSAEAMALVSTAMGFKREWARRAHVFAPAVHDSRFERFFLAAASGALSTPPARISAVHCGETIVGVEVALVCKNRLFGHVLAPRPGTQKQGVGKLLAGHAITSALAQGYDLYDTLAPADAYKQEWTTTSVAVADYAIARGWFGKVYVVVWARWGRAVGKAALKAWRRHRSRS